MVAVPQIGLCHEVSLIFNHIIKGFSGEIVKSKFTKEISQLDIDTANIISYTDYIN